MSLLNDVMYYNGDVYSVYDYEVHYSVFQAALSSVDMFFLPCICTCGGTETVLVINIRQFDLLK